MKIGDLQDLLDFVDEIAAPAEKRLREAGYPESEWQFLSLQLGPKATHAEHMAGTHDPKQIHTALGIIRLRQQCRQVIEKFSEDPRKAAAQLAAMAWNLHILSTALHAELVEGSLKHRPARQAKRRKGKYGLNRRVLEVAYRDGATKPNSVREWFESHRTVELENGEIVKVRWCDADDSHELSNINTRETKYLTDENMKSTLINIHQTLKGATR